MKKKSFLISLGLFLFFHSCKELSNTDFSEKASTIQSAIMEKNAEEGNLQRIKQVNRHLNRYKFMLLSTKKHDSRMDQAINDLAREINAKSLNSERLPLIEKTKDDISKDIWVVEQLVERLTSLLDYPKRNAKLISSLAKLGESERGRGKTKGVKKVNMLFNKGRLRDRTDVLIRSLDLISLKDALYSLRGTLRNIYPFNSICRTIIFEIDLISAGKEQDLFISLSGIKSLLSLLMDVDENGLLVFSGGLKRHLNIREDVNSDISSDDDSSDEEEALDSDSDNSMDIEGEVSDFKDEAQKGKSGRIEEQHIVKISDMSIEDLTTDFKSKIQMNDRPRREGIPLSKVEYILTRLYKSYEAIDSTNL